MSSEIDVGLLFIDKRGSFLYGCERPYGTVNEYNQRKVCFRQILTILSG